MFNDYFYHARIRKAVAVFGSLFNNIHIIRKNASNEVISQVRVPLSYAPKRDFLERIENSQNGEEAERQVAVKLPRMSFEIVSMNYDASRQLPKMNRCTIPSSTVDGSSTSLYTPVPYTISFQLNIYAKSQDDALQVVEQVLPFFTPQYTVTVNPLDDFSVEEDTPILFTGISFTDDYEAVLEARRTVVYSLDFDMRVFLYKTTGIQSSVITKYDIDLLDLEGGELFATVSDTANVPYNTESVLNEDSSVTVNTFKIRNVPRNPVSLNVLTAPENGAATSSLTNVFTTANGVVIAEGEWSYTPNKNFYGADSFVVALTYEDESTVNVPINVTVVNTKDAVTDNVTVNSGVATVIDISSNDTFDTAGTYVIASGGYPSHGTVTVQNGVFTYQSNSGYTGPDSFYYRFIPNEGTSEVGLVNITVT